jgi:hypothetical protein
MSLANGNTPPHSGQHKTGLSNIRNRFLFLHLHFIFFLSCASMAHNGWRNARRL